MTTIIHLAGEHSLWQSKPSNKMTAVALETFSFYHSFYRTTCSLVFISLDSVNSVVPGTHARQQCTVRQYATVRF